MGTGERREVRQKLLVPIANLGEQFDSLSYEQLIKRLKFQVKSQKIH